MQVEKGLLFSVEFSGHGHIFVLVFFDVHRSALIVLQKFE